MQPGAIVNVVLVGFVVICAVVVEVVAVFVFVISVVEVVVVTVDVVVVEVEDVVVEVEVVVGRFMKHFSDCRTRSLSSTHGSQPQLHFSDSFADMHCLFWLQNPHNGLSKHPSQSDPNSSGQKLSQVFPSI